MRHLGIRSLGLVVAILASMTPAVCAPVPTSSRLSQRREQALKLLDAGQYARAEMEFRAALSEALQGGARDEAVLLYNNIGACSLALHRYSAAFQAFVSAREAGLSCGASEWTAIASTNLASVFLMLGDGDSAWSLLREAARLAPPGSPTSLTIRAQQGRLALRCESRAEASERLADGIDAAGQSGDRYSEALLWDDLAVARLTAGDTRGAEAALANEYRLRVLYRLRHPELLYIRLSQLRRAQGRAGEALRFALRADDLQRQTAGSFRPWVTGQEVAAALQASGRPAEALRAYRSAWPLALEWQQEVLPAQSIETAADVSLSELASGYARLAAELSRTGDSRLAAEGLVVMEQNRAAGLRRMLLGRPRLRERLGAEYVDLLSRWRAEVARSLAQGGEQADSGRIRAYRAQLTALETRAGLGGALTIAAQQPAARLAQELTRAIRPETTLFSFLLAEPHSYLWTVTRAGIQCIELPSRSALLPLLASFRREVEHDGADARRLGAALYAKLFGDVPQPVLANPNWLLSLDDALFSSPLGALRTTAGAQGRFVAEEHSLQIIPSALWLLQPGRAVQRRTLLAVGDAVHNRGDRRFQGLRSAAQGSVPLSFWIFPWRRLQPAAPQALELPTLAGSRLEASTVSRLWSQPSRRANLLSGVSANQAAVESALAAKPDVVHFATHVVPLGWREAGAVLSHTRVAEKTAWPAWVQRPQDAFIALSLNADGSRGGINTAMVHAFDMPGSLVVLSGCSSALGDVQPGAGLMGFTRAWIAAGSSAVVASLWPVADDNGGFFTEFYRSLLDGGSTAVSIKAAQTAMLASRDWRAQPRYWGAYIVVSTE